MQVEEQSFISILFFLTFGLKPKRCKKCINETVFSSGTSCKDTNSRFTTVPLKPQFFTSKKCTSHFRRPQMIF